MNGSPTPHGYIEAGGRLSRRAIPKTADRLVTRCACGAWAWHNVACATCAALTRTRAAS